MSTDQYSPIPSSIACWAGAFACAWYWVETGSVFGLVVSLYAAGMAMHLIVDWRDFEQRLEDALHGH